MAGNYSGWSIEKLNKEVARIKKIIATKEARDRKAALAKVITVARKNGYELHELIDSKNLKVGIPSNLAGKTVSKGKRAKVPPKYRNPENMEETWTGRGRQPLWVRDAVTKGLSLEDIAIK